MMDKPPAETMRANAQAVAAAKRLGAHPQIPPMQAAVLGMLNTQDRGLLALVAEAMDTFPDRCKEAHVFPEADRLTVRLYLPGRLSGTVSIDPGGDLFDAYHPNRPSPFSRRFARWVDAFAWATMGEG